MLPVTHIKSLVGFEELVTACETEKLVNWRPIRNGLRFFKGRWKVMAIH